MISKGSYVNVITLTSVGLLLTHHDPIQKPSSPLLPDHGNSNHRGTNIPAKYRRDSEAIR